MNEPLLIEAVKADDVNWAQVLIEASKDLKKKDDYDYARAASNWEDARSDSAMVLLLLEAGAKQPDCVGRTYPLKAFGQFPVPTDSNLPPTIRSMGRNKTAQASSRWRFQLYKTAIQQTTHSTRVKQICQTNNTVLTV